jgi:hypothetical protein
MPWPHPLPQPVFQQHVSGTCEHAPPSLSSYTPNLKACTHLAPRPLTLEAPVPLCLLALR